MPQYTARRFASRAFAPGGVAVAALGLALGACSSGDARRQDAASGLNSDTALARDLSLANQQPAPQPQLQDVPAATPPAPAPPAPAPAAPAPAPAPRREVIHEVIRERAPRAPARPSASSDAPRRSNTAATSPAPSVGVAPAPAPRPNNAERGGVGTIPAGTTLLLASNRRVCTSNTSVGDHFTASLSESVTGSNGATIPAGATANVEVTSVNSSGSSGDPITLGLRVVSLNYGGHTYGVSATTETADVTRVKNGGASKDPQKVIGGAVAGAILGRIIGGNAKGTIIGAAAGAAGGAGVAAATARYDGCLNDGASIHVRLNDGVQVRLGAAPTGTPSI